MLRRSPTYLVHSNVLTVCQSLVSFCPSEFFRKIEISWKPSFVGIFRWNEGVIKGFWTFTYGQISLQKFFHFHKQFYIWMWSITDLDRWGPKHNNFYEHIHVSKSGSFKWKIVFLFHRWHHSSNIPGTSQIQVIVSFLAATTTVNLCLGFHQLARLIQASQQLAIPWFPSSQQNYSKNWIISGTEYRRQFLLKRGGY